MKSKLATWLIIILNALLINYSSAQEKIPYIWKNVEIGGGGFVCGIITSEAEKGLIYCKTDVGGAYRWDTLTSGWIPLNDDLTSANWGLQGIESLALDPSDPQKVYLAAGEYVQWSETAMFRSVDKGNNWQKSAVGFKCGGNDYGRSVDERLVVDPNKPNTLLMGTRESGLYKSTDGAVTWKKLANFPVTTTKSKTGISFVKFIKSSGTNGNETPLIICGVARTSESNLFISRDTGLTWAAIPEQSTQFMPVHAALAADTLLYIAYSDTSGPYATSNGAVVKFNINTGEFADVSPVKNAKKAYSGLSVYPSNPLIIYASTISGWPDEVYRTTDGGLTWKAILTGSTRHSDEFKYTQGTTYHWVADVEVDPFDSNHVMFVTGYGIWRTTDAGNIDNGENVNWHFAGKGLEETVVQEVVSPAFGVPLISAIADYDGFRHDNLDLSPSLGFHNPATGTTTGLAFAENMPSLIVRAGDKAYYSLDNGISWKSFKTIPSGARRGKMAVSADGKTIVWAPDALVPYYTNNFGATWTACSGLSTVGIKIIADRVNPKMFYYYNKGGSVWSSINGAQSFEKSSKVIGDGGDLIAALGKEGHLWLPLKGNGLYLSENKGISFIKISSVQSADAVGTGKAFPDQDYPCVYIIGTVGGVYGFYRSDDKGVTWEKINNDKQNFGGLSSIVGDSRVPGRAYVISNFNGRGIVYGIPQTDCHGDSAGGAFIDDCGVCAGGNTGVSSCVKDCSGEVNGSASFNACGVCSGGNTGIAVDECLQSAIIQKTNEDFSLAPNPFSESIELTTLNSVNYKLYSLLGTVLGEGVCNKSVSLGNDLTSGVYFLSLQNKEQLVTVKLIKN